MGSHRFKNRGLAPKLEALTNWGMSLEFMGVVHAKGVLDILLRKIRCSANHPHTWLKNTREVVDSPQGFAQVESHEMAAKATYLFFPLPA